jgi:hypothetical protein
MKKTYETSIPKQDFIHTPSGRRDTGHPRKRLEAKFGTGNFPMP